MSTNRTRRLAKAVKARRDELDLSQLDVWQNGGPSNTTLTDIENERTETLTRTTARKLDAALKWEPGSARRVWEGGEPTPLAEGDLEDEVRNGPFSPAAKEYMLRLLAEDRERAAARETERGAS